MTLQQCDIGLETLRRMSALDAYNRWIIHEIQPWVGDVVLEVGAGIGNIAQFFFERKQLILTDVQKDYIELLHNKFVNYSNISYELYDLEESGEHLQNRGIDTIIALNVLEHIRDDVHALRELAAILSPGGHLILQLPAHRFLYGSLDRYLDHYRRYTMGDIKNKFRVAGLTPVKLWRINIFGTFGWFMCSRVLRRKILPTNSLSIFNKLTPVFTAFERMVPIPFGLSIIAVGRKK